MTTEPTVVDPGEDQKDYLVDGEPYVRVTSVIDAVMGGPKSGMAFWGGNRFADFMEAVLDGTEFETTAEDIYAEWLASPFNPNTVKKEAGKRGQQAHDLFEALILGKATVETTTQPSAPYLVNDGAIVFAPTSYDLGVVKAYLEIAQGIEGLLPEKRVYSKAYRYAGKSDLIGGSVVCDVKTHKPPAYYTDFVQMAAYSQAWWEMTGQVIDTHIAILPHEDGTYTPFYSYVSPKVFLNVLEIYRDMQSTEVTT